MMFLCYSNECIGVYIKRRSTYVYVLNVSQWGAMKNLMHNTGRLYVIEHSCVASAVISGGFCYGNDRDRWNSAYIIVLIASIIVLLRPLLLFHEVRKNYVAINYALFPLCW